MKRLALLALALTGLAAQAHAATPLQAALEQYVKIQTALAADSLKGIPEAANAIIAAVQASGGALPDTAASQAQAVAKAPDIKAARTAFKPLSATLITALSSEKEKTGRYYEAFCPMAGAAWIQADKKVANPYYGASMLTCGEIRKEL